jgi:hypothetical protein
MKHHLSKIKSFHKAEALKSSSFSRANLTVFAIIFAAIGGYLIYSSFAATPTNCFAEPGACGYPDPNYNNVGVPSGTTLTASGSITITTPGTVIDGLNITTGAGGGGSGIYVKASNVTIKNTRITINGAGCGQSPCGNSMIKVFSGSTNTTISHVDLLTSGGATVEHSIRNEAGTTTHADHVYAKGADSNWWGSGTMSDSWMIALPVITSDHIENTYTANGTIVLDHNVMLNAEGYTALQFSEQTPLDTAACTNHVTIKNSLLAGGGYMIEPCAHATGVGSASLDVEGNHFARCISGTCPDTHGYFAKGGTFGVTFNAYCPPGNNAIWSNNIWDDDNTHTVNCDGSQGPPPTGGTAPTSTISANPTSITSGSSSTLTWSSTDATSCTASNGWTGTKATSGTQSVSPTATTTYALTCTGTGGTSSPSSAVVTVSNTSTPKPADIDKNGVVDITDLSYLLSSYGQTTTTCTTNSSFTCDIATTPSSTNGKIDIFDLSLLLSGYGK